MQTLIKELTFKEDQDYYPFLMGISTDSLIILTKDKEFVEWIIIGKDDNGTLATTDNQDEFLDAIVTIRNMIVEGINPLLYIR